MSEKSSRERKLWHRAFAAASPIMVSYVFVSMAYGLTMQKAGFAWPWSLFVSLTVYTGAFQFVLSSFLAAGASYLTIVLTALFMNSRQLFYALPSMQDVNRGGRLKPYLIHTMTDETFAVNLTLPEEDLDRPALMARIAFLARISWMAGAVAGGIFGQILPFDTEGIDFCMTALFLVILTDQWEKTGNRRPILLGLGFALFFLLVLGSTWFLLPSLAVTAALLAAANNRKKGEQS